MSLMGHGAIAFIATVTALNISIKKTLLCFFFSKTIISVTHLQTKLETLNLDESFTLNRISIEK